MNLAYKYPLIFWNTANLIVDSAGIDYSSSDEENVDEIAVSDDTDTTPDEADEEIVSIYEPEDWEGYEYEDLPDRSGKKKKKVKTMLYQLMKNTLNLVSMIVKQHMKKMIW